MTMDLTGKTIGGYQLDKKIGSGGSATIYKAYQPHLERWVAVKVLRRYENEALDDFKREVQAISHLRHRNIIIVYDYGEQDNWPYVVMEYVEGQTLAGRIAGQPLHWIKAVDAIVPIAEALAYAHKEGVVHGNIKPANILLPQKNWPLLSDFGLMTLGQLDHDGSTGPAVRVVGTPAYLSPEQGRGERPDYRSDIYALGAVLFEAVTGRPPFDYPDPNQILAAHASEQLPSLRQFSSDCPPILELVTITAMQKLPEHRYKSMEEMVTALKDALASSDVRPIFYASSRKVPAKTALFDTSGLLTDKPTPPPPVAAIPTPTGEARLFFLESKITLPVPDRESVIIGRTHQNVVADIDLGPQRAAQAGISRRHARLTQQGGNWLISDLGSLNGTFVNNIKLSPGDAPYLLKNGDEIRCSKLAFLFLVSGET